MDGHYGFIVKCQMYGGGCCSSDAIVKTQEVSNSEFELEYRVRMELG